jgi:hypothetical protein
MAHILPTEKKVAVISMLCEGSSIGAIERITGVQKKPLAVWLSELARLASALWMRKCAG